MANRTDDFNRADGFLGGSTPSDGLSPAWVDLINTSAIFSGQVYATGGVALTTLDTSTADVEVQATAVVLSNGAGIIARVTDSNNYIAFYAGFGTFYLYKYVSGSATYLINAVGSASNGDVLKLTLVGSTVQAFVNGVQQGTDFTVTDGQTATKHGVFVVDNTSRLDNWSSVDASGTPDTPELYGAPFGNRGQKQMAQLLSQ